MDVSRIRRIVIAGAALSVALGGVGHARSSSAPIPDACALLTDADVLAATGAAAVTSAEPVSSLAVAGYGAGCTRELEPPGGLPEHATLELDYGFGDPGGRRLYEGERAVVPEAVRVGGLGDEAFEGPSGEWYAVKGDATVTLQYLGIGLFDAALRPGDLARRALTWRIMSGLPGGATTSTDGPVCLLGTAELGELVGVPFETASAGDLNCMYQGDPATGAFALDVRLEEPSPGSTDADLMAVRMGPGEEATVAGLPAWVSDDALWVDLGIRRLAVQPIFEFSDVVPLARDVTVPIAEAVIERLPPELANPTPEPTPPNDQALAALFPSELRGAPVTVQTLQGPELLAQLGPVAADAMRARIAEYGATPDDLSLGIADLFNGNDRDGSILAIRLRGADAATFGIPLLLATQGAADLPIGQRPDTVAGRDVQVLDVPGVDPARAIHAYARDDVAWFVTATTCTTYTPEQGCVTEEVDRPLLEEILGALP